MKTSARIALAAVIGAMGFGLAGCVQPAQAQFYYYEDDDYYQPPRRSYGYDRGYGYNRGYDYYDRRQSQKEYWRAQKEAQKRAFRRGQVAPNYGYQQPYRQPQFNGAPAGAYAIPPQRQDPRANAGP